MEYLMKINVLGTDYHVIARAQEEDPKLIDSDGYVDTTIKHIIVDDMRESKSDPNSKQNLDYYKRQVLRHEIIHAFLFESGLEASCDWAVNEEVIDWIAIQIPKIAGIMEQGGLL